MKRIANNWIYGLAIVAWIAAGCSGINPARTIKPRDVNFYAPGTESFQEVWVIQRNREGANAFQQSRESGGLKAVVDGAQREMPLGHMDVNATVNGYIGAVEVRQEFENPYAQKIEAVYVFSLPADAAVDDFIMTIGKRRIRGIIRERKDVEAIYEEAKRQGYLASLLTADQGNIFRQSIANIEPGNNIDVRIHYFQTLDIADGWQEFLIPTASNAKGNSTHQNVPVSLHMDVTAAAPIADLQSPTHVIVKKSISPEHWTVQLGPEDGMPNEEFKLRYRLANRQPLSELMAYQDERGGYFTLMLQSPNASSPLTNLKIDWGAMQTSEIYPRGMTNLPSGHAVLLAGRFSGTSPTSILVTGTAGGQPVSFSIPVDVSKTSTEKAIPKIWAGTKITDLARQSATTGDLDLLRETRQVALDYGLASPFTAFLAVNAGEVTEDGKTITVPAVP